MKKGFTLIELLIVMAIIGLLSSILIPNISGAQNKAKEAAVKAVMYNIQVELEGYQIDNGSYPDGSNISIAELAPLIPLKSTPKNPFTGKEYTSQDKAGQITYTYTTDPGYYTLEGFKKDGQTVLHVLTNK